MANNRLFEVEGLSFNGEAVGGLASLGFDGGYQDVPESDGDGAVGAEDVDRAGLRVAWNLATTDVAKVNALMAAAVGNTEFSGRESGLATYRDYVVPGLVPIGFTLNLPKATDAVLTLNGLVRFATAATDLDDIFAATAAQPAPTKTYPARLFRPHTVSYADDPAVAPTHLESINLSLAAQRVHEDYSDTDIGETAVDVGPWAALKIALVLKDYSVSGTSDMAAKLMMAATGKALTATLSGRGGAADKTLTVNNVIWTGHNKTKAKDYWQWTINGSAGWKNGETEYTLNGSPKLFSIA